MVALLVVVVGSLLAGCTSVYPGQTLVTRSEVGLVDIFDSSNVVKPTLCEVPKNKLVSFIDLLTVEETTYYFVRYEGCSQDGWAASTYFR